LREILAVLARVEMPFEGHPPVSISHFRSIG
jgi:hypothetical protein